MANYCDKSETPENSEVSSLVLGTTNRDGTQIVAVRLFGVTGDILAQVYRLYLFIAT